jgi:succinate dehydrogenase/fumarate reductase flavoprotein subunit
MRKDIPYLYARDPHELMRAIEAQHILDCAEMAAVASLYRTESRWGLYHYSVDYPEQNDAEWYCHVQLYKDEQGQMACRKRAIEPYVVELDDTEKNAYRQLRIKEAV